MPDGLALRHSGRCTIPWIHSGRFLSAYIELTGTQNGWGPAAEVDSRHFDGRFRKVGWEKGNYERQHFRIIHDMGIKETQS